MFYNFFSLQVFDGSVAAADGEARVAISVPPRGRLHSIAVCQTAGSLDGFTVEVLSKKEACLPNFPEPVAGTAVDDPRLYLVAMPLTSLVNDPATAAFFESGGFAYINNDTVLPADRGKRTGSLYVRIVADSPSVAKKFDISLGIEDYD